MITLDFSTMPKKSEKGKEKKQTVKGFGNDNRIENLRKNDRNENFNKHVILENGVPMIRIQIKTSNGNGERKIPIPQKMLKYFFDDEEINKFADFYTKRAKKNSESRKRNSESPIGLKTSLDLLNESLGTSNKEIYTVNGDLCPINETETIIIILDDGKVVTVFDSSGKKVEKKQKLSVFDRAGKESEIKKK